MREIIIIIIITTTTFSTMQVYNLTMVTTVRVNGNASKVGVLIVNIQMYDPHSISLSHFQFHSCVSKLYNYCIINYKSLMELV